MAKRKTSKSEAIRQELAKHPDKPVKDIAKALKVQPALVYNVKSNLKGKAGRKRRSGKRRRAPGSLTNGSAEQVIATARPIKSCGGIDAARHAL